MGTAYAGVAAAFEHIWPVLLPILAFAALAIGLAKWVAWRAKR